MVALQSAALKEVLERPSPPPSFPPAPAPTMPDPSLPSTSSQPQHQPTNSKAFAKPPPPPSQAPHQPPAPDQAALQAPILGREAARLPGDGGEGHVAHLPPAPPQGEGPAAEEPQEAPPARQAGEWRRR